jgi:hypothetical protein
MGKDLSLYDFTLKAENYDVDWVKEKCKELFSKWVFQKECGETGYAHFQGRGSLIKNRTEAYVVKNLKPCDAWRWSITSGEVYKDTGNRFNYVMKADTRIEGPWSDLDKAPEYIPRHVRNLIMRPWQQLIIDTRFDFEERWINVLIDTKTEIGKSCLITTMATKYGCVKVPPFEKVEWIMEVVIAEIKMLNKKSDITFLFDIPKGIRHQDSRQLWNAIEIIKTGYAYDRRNKWERIFFDPPKVWVFTNTNPLKDEGLYRNNVYKLWEVNSGMDLVPYEQVDTDQSTSRSLRVEEQF